MRLEPGTRIGQYEIVAPLGAGGMGEVYRARDAKLHRDVALKILPEAFAGGGADQAASRADRLARFTREAQTLAALNHPNIAQIYGLEESGPTPALVMELVEGDDLSQRIARGALPLAEAVPIARQIAEGLEAAHEHGIVHRDLKPSNVKVRHDGTVKVLDFGLAKAIESAGLGLDAGEPPGGAAANSPTITTPAIPFDWRSGHPEHGRGVTRAGVILGTAAYMAPEQAKGRPVDRRADIWAFGLVLHEMLTGRTLFARDSVPETLGAIFQQEISLGDLPSGTPPAIRRLLARCLERDPRRRLRDIGEARIALETPLATMQAETASAGAPAAGRFGPAAAAVAVAVGLAGLAAGYLLRRAPVAVETISPDVAVRQLTFDAGLESDPSFSPDGNYVAYTMSDRGFLEVVVLPLAGGTPRRLAAGDADSAHPAWSPDGTQIAFTSARDRGGRLRTVGGLGAATPLVQGGNGDIFVAPAAGGPAAKLIERASYPAWSPDGSRIAFQSDRSGQWDIWTVPVQGGEPTPLTADDSIDYQPAWSPDGRWIAFASLGELKVVPGDGSGPPVGIVTSGEGVLSPAWSPDGRWIYYASDRAAARQGSRVSLWRVAFPVPDGRSPLLQRVTLGESSDTEPALSLDGRRIAYSRVSYAPDVWELDVRSGALRQITTAASLDDYPHVSPDGRLVAFFSDRTGRNTQIWIQDLASQIASLVPNSSSEPQIFPRWSPDGTRIVCIRNAADASSLVVQEPGALVGRVVLSAPPGALNGPDWSPDGSRLAYEETIDGLHTVWVTDLNGERRQVTRMTGRIEFPSWAPDGRWIAFQREEDGPRQIWVVPAEGGEPRQVTSGSLEHSHPAWSPVDPDKILIVVNHENLAELSVGDGSLRYLTTFTESNLVVDYATWSPDGAKVYFSITRRTGDLFLMDGY